MMETERSLYILILFAGLFALGYGAYCFVRGKFTVWSIVGQRSLDGNWGTAISLIDVLLGFVAIVYSVVGLAAPQSAFFADLNNLLGLPARGELTLELLNGEQVDLGAALFYLYWGFWQVVVSTSPFYLQRFINQDR